MCENPQCPQCGRTVKPEDCVVIDAEDTEESVIVYRCPCGPLAVVEGERVTWYVPMGDGDTEGASLARRFCAAYAKADALIKPCDAAAFEAVDAGVDVYEYEPHEEAMRAQRAAGVELEGVVQEMLAYYAAHPERLEVKAGEE